MQSSKVHFQKFWTNEVEEMKAVRISAGAGYAGDRIEPALENIRRGNVDYIMFECLAERTIALAQKDRAADPQKGYNRLLEYRMERVLPLLREHPVKIITNMGAANPVAAAEKVRKMAAQYDLTDLKIAAVIGDEVTERIPAYGDLAIMETGEPLHTLAQVEPLGPKRLLDLLIVAPCTGNTLGKLANGIADSPVSFACKAHLRNGRPVLLAVSTNDGLSASAESIGKLLNRKHYYFVPFGQDSPEKKPYSLVADFTRLPETVAAALENRQIQPILL